MANITAALDELAPALEDTNELVFEDVITDGETSFEFSNRSVDVSAGYLTLAGIFLALLIHFAVL